MPSLKFVLSESNMRKPQIPTGHSMANPFRAAFTGGHELNESYKMPAPNSRGANESYMHPVVSGGRGSNTQKLSAKQNKPAGPVNMGKNPY